MDNSVFLVTGGAGFIGYHISRALLEKGYKVIGYDNMNDYYDIKLKNKRLKILAQYELYTFYEKDVADYASLQKVVDTYQIEFIIHLAAQAGVRYSISNPKTYIDSNIIGMFNILEVCRNCNVKNLVYASSSSVYGNSENEKLSEKQMVDQPISLYAATKKSNELFAYAYSNNYKFNSVGLRFFTVYGPYGRPDMAYYGFVDKILKGEVIQVYNYGNQYRDFTYIDDLISGMMSLIELQKEKEKASEYKVYNIGNGNPVKLTDFIYTLEKVVGKRAKLEYTERVIGDVDRTYADISLLKEITGYTPVTDIQQGLISFYKWYSEYNNVR